MMSTLAAPRIGRCWCAATACFLSPWLGSACRFEPTCSGYALDALEQHGAAAGSYLAHGACCAAIRGAPAASIRCPTARLFSTRLRTIAVIPDICQRTLMTDIRRTLLWVVFSMSLVLLWDAWNKHNGQPSLFGAAPPRPAASGAAAGGRRLAGWRADAGRRRAVPTPVAGAAATAPAGAAARGGVGRRRRAGRDHDRRRQAPRSTPTAAIWCGSSCCSRPTRTTTSARRAVRPVAERVSMSHKPAWWPHSRRRSAAQPPHADARVPGETRAGRRRRTS